MASHPTPTNIQSPAQPLALRAAETAKALRISPRLLSTLTSENRIPHFHIGRVVLYPVADLERWLSEQVSKEVSS
ncbi:MAG: helix-turn-helix domain-containing protein [Planctomycetota bacterium]|nr:MAG: helix-turn-helix domain-containing protein [Planctomycetota bacterium]